MITLFAQSLTHQMRLHAYLFLNIYIDKILLRLLFHLTLGQFHLGHLVNRFGWILLVLRKRSSIELSHIFYFLLSRLWWRIFLFTTASISLFTSKLINNLWIPFVIVLIFIIFQEFLDLYPRTSLILFLWLCSFINVIITWLILFCHYYLFLEKAFIIGIYLFNFSEIIFRPGLFWFVRIIILNFRLTWLFLLARFSICRFKVVLYSVK